MALFLLVHGAWQTARTWDLVASRLRAAGHEVAIPHLSGLENEGTPLSPAITLRTHIQDVVEIFTRKDLHHATLVGHSYAGMIITGVAELIAQRLDRLVYVDAFVPADGQSALDILPPAVAQMFRQTAESTGGGWLLRAGEAQLEMWGLAPGEARDFVRSCMSDFSLRCFEEAVTIPTDAASKLDRTFIACVAEQYPARSIFQQFGDRAKREGWTYHELPTGHACHVQLPEAFVAKLLSRSAAA